MAVDDALAQYDEREKLIGEEQMRAVERAVMLSIVDVRWKDHLLDMDYLQEGIHLRALGQRDPLAEYKTEGYVLFEDMLDGVRQSVVMTLMKNSPEDLAFFAAQTLDQPMLALNYTSGDDLAYQTSFAGAAGAAGAVSSTGDAYGASPAAQGAPAMAARPQAADPGRPAGRGRTAAPRRAEARPQRSLLVRQRQEVQEVSWGVGASLAPCNAVASTPDGEGFEWEWVG